MIREDRIKLNERFIKVFNLLLERGDVVLNDRNGRGIGDFAEKVLGNRAYGHIIRAYLNDDDKRVIDYRQARIVCQEFGVNEAYMIDGIGTPFGMDLPVNVDGDSPKGNILFTSVGAFAGSGIDIGATAASGSAENLQFFSLPGLTGNGLVAFPIEGDSMEPIIKDGDTVVCREIAGAHEIKDNKMYAIKSNGSLWVKYVQRVFDSKGKVRQLKLISANYLEFDPFIEDVNEHTRLYKVTRIINNI